MSILPSESVNVDDLIKKLKNNGWEDWQKYVPDFTPHSLLDDYFFDSLIFERIEKINILLFEKIKLEDKRKIFEDVKISLKGSNPIKILDYLKEGMEVVIKKRRERIYLIDYDNLINNVFFYLHEAKFKGSPNNIKPDLTLVINGIPVIIIEAKKESDVYSEFKAIDQIIRYEKESPDLFKYVQFAIAHGDDKKYFVTFPNFEKEFRTKKAFIWKNEKKQKIITDMLMPEMVLEFLKYFLFFEKTDKGISKIICRYIQYYSVKKVLKRINDYLNGTDKKNKGLIWHWQGSGKTYTMFFIANMFFEKFYSSSPIVLFIVDRADLEKQLSQEIEKLENFKYKSSLKKVESIPELKEIVNNIRSSETNANVMFRGLFITTIQKFQKGSEKEDNETLKQIINEIGSVNKKEVLVLVDEAQRTQYGELSGMLKKIFENCLRFGFTGTPIMADEKNTFEEFSYPDKNEFYLHRYFIGDSIDDGFTLPLTYTLIKESGIDIFLSEDSLNKFIKDYRQNKLSHEEDDSDIEITKTELNKEITKSKLFLMSKDRIQKVVDLIKERVEKDTEDFKFKVMIVAYNRIACVRYKNLLDKELSEKYGESAKDWSDVVMTFNYNEKHNDIIEYKEELTRKKGKTDFNEINKDIQENFKKEDKLKILIVTDMLLTGFDVPKLKVMYLDKPLQSHRLLQAIARTNRPYPDKKIGLIVDSIGLLKNLSQTMEIYGKFENYKLIDEDFKQNLLRNLDSILYDFETKLKDLKEDFISIKINTQLLSINIENILDEIRTNKFKLEDLKDKISLISIYTNINFSDELTDEQVKIVKLVNDLRETIKLYKALGAHPEKLKYSEQIEILSFIYVYLRRQQNKKKKSLSSNQEFWHEVEKFISNKIFFGDLEEVNTVEINKDYINNIINSGSYTVKSPVADYYFSVLNDIPDELNDPVYKEIYRKVKNLHSKWMNRDIQLIDFLKALEQEEELKKAYDKSINEKPLKNRIIDALNISIIDHLLKNNPDKSLSFKSTVKIIDEIIPRGALFSEIPKITSNYSIQKITTTQKKNLSEAILLDLFQEQGNNIKDEKLIEIGKIIDELIDSFVIPILEN